MYPLPPARGGLQLVNDVIHAFANVAEVSVAQAVRDGRAVTGNRAPPTRRSFTLV